MKRIISIILILLSVSPLFAQLQDVGTYRVANNSTAFGYPLSKGAKIFDAATGDIYTLLKSVKSTATLSGLIENTDYEQFLPLHGTADNSLKLNSYGTYYSGITSSYIPTVFKDVNGYFGTEVGQYIDFHENPGTNDFNTRLISINDSLYVAFGSTATNYLIWNKRNMGTGSGLDADMLDGQHGSYYLDYNNLTNKPTTTTTNGEYIGIRNPYLWTVTPVNSGSFRIYQHISSTGITVQSGTINASADSNFVNITVSGNYEIRFSFSFTSSVSDLITFRDLVSTTEILSIKNISATSNTHYSVTLETTKYLIAGKQIYIQVAGANSTPTVSFQYMNIFVRKL